MKFTKMHGCGNDYVYIETITQKVEDKAGIVKWLSNRNFGIGSDGVIYINEIEGADFEMEMYNADGSRSQMCGNGIRCVGKFVYDYGFTDKTTIDVISYGQKKVLELNVEDGEVKSVKVNMGSPILTPSDVPVAGYDNMEKVVSENLKLKDKEFKFTAVSMGNPHAVIFVDEITDELVFDYGSKIEVCDVFPERTNVEFVQVVDKNHVNMRVWERGTGETLCCGTGCCATAVAAILNNLADDTVFVKTPGGELEITWDRAENLVFMTGPAETVYEGNIFIK